MQDREQRLAEIRMVWETGGEEGWRTLPDAHLAHYVAEDLDSLASIEPWAEVALHALFDDDRWLQTQLRAQDGRFDGYLEDLYRAWQRANVKIDEEPGALRRCLHYAFIATTINQLAGEYAPELLSAAVAEGVWSSEKAFDLAKLIPYPFDRYRALNLLIELGTLSSQHEEEARRLRIESAYQRRQISTSSILDDNPRADDVANLVPTFRFRWEIDLVIANLHRLDWGAGDVLSALIESTPEPLQPAVHEAFFDIEEHQLRAMFLVRLFPELDGEQLQRAISVALHSLLQYAQTLGGDWMVSRLGREMANLLPYLNERQVREAIAAAEACPAEACIPLWAELSTRLPPCEREELIRRALMLVQSLPEPESERAWWQPRYHALSALAPYLTPPFIPGALSLVAGLESQFRQERILTLLAPNILEDPTLMQLIADQLGHEILERALNGSEGEEDEEDEEEDEEVEEVEEAEADPSTLGNTATPSRSSSDFLPGFSFLLPSFAGGEPPYPPERMALDPEKLKQIQPAPVKKESWRQLVKTLVNLLHADKTLSHSFLQDIAIEKGRLERNLAPEHASLLGDFRDLFRGGVPRPLAVVLPDLDAEQLLEVVPLLEVTGDPVVLLVILSALSWQATPAQLQQGVHLVAESFVRLARSIELPRESTRLEEIILGASSEPLDFWYRDEEDYQIYADALSAMSFFDASARTMALVAALQPGGDRIARVEILAQLLPFLSPEEAEAASACASNLITEMVDRVPEVTTWRLRTHLRAAEALRLTGIARQDQLRETLLMAIDQEKWPRLQYFWSQEDLRSQKARFNVCLVALIARHLDEANMTLALDLVKASRDGFETGAAAQATQLALLIRPGLSPMLLERFIDVALEVWPLALQRQAVATIVKQFGVEQFPWLLADIRQIEQTDSHGYTGYRAGPIQAIAPYVPETFAGELMEIALTIEGEWHRAQTFAALVPYVPREIRSRILKELPSLTSPKLRALVFSRFLVSVADRDEFRRPARQAFAEALWSMRDDSVDWLVGALNEPYLETGLLLEAEELLAILRDLSLWERWHWKGEDTGTG